MCWKKKKKNGSYDIVVIDSVTPKREKSIPTRRNPSWHDSGRPANNRCRGRVTYVYRDGSVHCWGRRGCIRFIVDLLSIVEPTLGFPISLCLSRMGEYSTGTPYEVLTSITLQKSLTFRNSLHFSPMDLNMYTFSNDSTCEFKTRKIM